MYDFEDYLVATLSTLFVTVPALIMLWQIFRATFPKRVVRELSSTKRRHRDVGDDLDLTAISTHHIARVTPSRTRHLLHVDTAQKANAKTHEGEAQ